MVLSTVPPGPPAPATSFLHTTVVPAHGATSPRPLAAAASPTVSSSLRGLLQTPAHVGVSERTPQSHPCLPHHPTGPWGLQGLVLPMGALSTPASRLPVDPPSDSTSNTNSSGAFSHPKLSEGPLLTSPKGTFLSSRALCRLVTTHSLWPQPGSAFSPATRRTQHGTRDTFQPIPTS